MTMINNSFSVLHTIGPQILGNQPILAYIGVILAHFVPGTPPPQPNLAAHVWRSHVDFCMSAHCCVTCTCKQFHA